MTTQTEIIKDMTLNGLFGLNNLQMTIMEHIIEIVMVIRYTVSY